MKLAELDNPVRASWLADQSFRLDPGPYISDSYAARMFLKRLPRTESLGEVTEGIFNAGRFKRHWTTDPEHGVPFLSSADIFQSDLSSLAMITKNSFQVNSNLGLEPGWTLITCSGMTAGRVTYARLDMDGYACSQHVLRVVPDLSRISAGYLYTFLASPFGVPMIKGGIYGTSVRHIEPSHIVDLPVPRVDAEVERRIDFLIQEAMVLRARFQAGITDATQDLFKSAGLPELIDFNWHDLPRDLDFSVSGLTPTSLRALNFSPRAQRLIETLRSVPHRTLGEICSGGQLSRGNRFKRIDSDPVSGVKLIGQRQGFWLRPEGRWIALSSTDLQMVRADDETILVAARGTLGDSEVYSRALFVTGSWLKHGYSEDFLRVVSADDDFSGAYLFAFLRSEVVFRVIRSMSTGGKQQDIHEGLRRQIPVPECTPEDRERIAETVRQAYRWRDEADMKEDQALALLDAAVREAAR
ncbi:methylation-associated defense system restriction endonuclease subunit S MAD5 [Streptosporangium amethystogenes]|uniref:methylation-associated defense system restriction endonuclease subunit S MAD5 n=1 Tax=Streptosporangium amethystogenes TaxID=2002 RepID=UPI0004C63A9C|nr:restriction endonuclease subunit S [Streptosporangium amethystogenes]